jgi:hypothetical protein
LSKSQEDWIREVGSDMTDILVRKNYDYADAFSKRFQKHGILSAYIRMEDKWLRLENLISGHKAQVNDEGLLDTLRDLSGYIQLTIIELLKEAEQNKQQ